MEGDASGHRRRRKDYAEKPPTTRRRETSPIPQPTMHHVEAEYSDGPITEVVVGKTTSAHDHLGRSGRTDYPSRGPRLDPQKEEYDIALTTAGSKKKLQVMQDCGVYDEFSASALSRRRTTYDVGETPYGREGALPTGQPRLLQSYSTRTTPTPTRASTTRLATSTLGRSIEELQLRRHEHCAFVHTNLKEGLRHDPARVLPRGRRHVETMKGNVRLENPLRMHGKYMSPRPCRL